jgi:hypothetical protein
MDMEMANRASEFYRNRAHPWFIVIHLGKPRHGCPFSLVFINTRELLSRTMHTDTSVERQQYVIELAEL